MRAGPSLRFHMDVIIALTGAEFHADIDGVAVPFWTSVLVKAGSVLTIGTVSTVCFPGSAPVFVLV